MDDALTSTLEQLSKGLKLIQDLDLDAKIEDLLQYQLKLKKKLQDLSKTLINWEKEINKQDFDQRLDLAQVIKQKQREWQKNIVEP